MNGLSGNVHEVQVKEGHGDRFSVAIPKITRGMPLIQQPYLMRESNLMSEIIERPAETEISASALSRLILSTDFAMVRRLAIEEIAPVESKLPLLGLLNVSALSENPGGGRVGLCVMLVGTDDAGKILWGCCLMGQHQGNEPLELFESLLVAPQVIGKTTKITIRTYGGRFPPQNSDKSKK